MGANGRGKGKRSSTAPGPALVVAGLMATAATAELAMRRSPTCPCGMVRLWHGPVRSPENSQQLLDWYSLSHLVHGILFYAATRLLPARPPWPWRLAMVVALEAGWEVLENTPAMIDRYRSVTMAWGYAGDSVLNSMGDIVCMIVGFLLAKRLPIWASAALAIGCEVTALAAIRDNLTLNVLMLAWPVEAVRGWQGGG